MANKKIVSLRMSKDLLQDVDNYLLRRPYLNRSSLIEKCVSAVMRCASEKDTHLVLKTYDPFAEGVIIQVAN